MTNLQVQYQQLQEQKRANLAKEQLTGKEIDVKAFDAETKRMEEALKELKAPYEIQKLIAETDATEEQKKVFTAQLDKISAEIRNINANTSLTNAQKYNEYVKLGNSLTNLVARFTGVRPMGDTMDWVRDVVGNFLGGLGKGVGGGLIG